MEKRVYPLTIYRYTKYKQKYLFTADCSCPIMTLNIISVNGHQMTKCRFLLPAVLLNAQLS